MGSAEKGRLRAQFSVLGLGQGELWFSSVRRGPHQEPVPARSGLTLGREGCRVLDGGERLAVWGPDEGTKDLGERLAKRKPQKRKVLVRGRGPALQPRLCPSRRRRVLPVRLRQPDPPGVK